MNTLQAYDLVTLGESMVVFSPPDGELLDQARTMTMGIGGAESNVSIGLARLGHQVQWVSRVGDDAFGRRILRTLRGEGVDVSRAAIDKEHATGIYFKQHLPEGSTETLYFRKESAAAQLSEADVDNMGIGRYLLVTGISVALSPSARVAIERAMQRARKYQMKIIFDPNIRFKLWRSREEALGTMEQIAQRADIIVPGIEEGRAITGRMDYRAIAEWFLERNPNVTVVLKLGREGAYYHNAAESGLVEGFVVREQDEVGAGDAFAAGLLSGLLDDQPLAGAVRRACAIGAMVAATRGDFEGLPTRGDLYRFLNSRRKPSHQQCR